MTRRGRKFFWGVRVFNDFLNNVWFGFTVVVVFITLSMHTIKANLFNKCI